MKEAEFRALLAIEGLELVVERTYFRKWDLDGKNLIPHTMASIVKRDGDGYEQQTILTTDWVQRRYYAVQSLIKRYYGERG